MLNGGAETSPTVTEPDVLATAALEATVKSDWAEVKKLGGETTAPVIGLQDLFVLLLGMLRSRMCLKSQQPEFGQRCSGLPVVGEAAPQALAVAPQQPVEDAVEQAVQVEAVHVGLPPDPLQRRAHVGSHDIQHLRKVEERP